MTLVRDILETARRNHTVLDTTICSAVLAKQSVRATIAGMSLYENAFQLGFLVEKPRHSMGVHVGFQGAKHIGFFWAWA